MTTVNYTAEHNVAAGFVKVEWSGLSAMDDGEPFDCSGFEIGSVQYSGTFSGGQAKMLASNEILPTNFVEVESFNAPGIRFLNGTNGGTLSFTGHVKPFFDSGGGGINVTLLLVRK